MFKLIKITLYGLMILHCASKFHAQMVNENLHTKDDDGDDNDAKLTVKGKDVTKVESMTVMVQPSVALEKENVQRLGAEYEKLKLIPMPLLIEEKEAIVKEIQEMQEDAEHKLATTEGEHKGDVEAKVQDSQPIEVEEEVILKELQQTMAGEQQQVLEQEDTSLPLDAESNVLAVNRTGRQLFYSPNFFYIQNIGVEGSKCVTSRGLLGICLGFDRCSLQQRRKRQLAFYSLTQLPQQFTAYAQQQQEEICTFYDQYARTSSGVCCTGISNVTPIMPSQQPLEPSGEEIPVLANEDGPAIVEDMNPTEFPKEGESSEDSDVLEPPENYNYEPEPPKYDNTELQDGNNIGYDPVYENLKQAQVYNNYNNYIRYPWPSQFVGFSGVQQWPPPLPTHPPSTASWPPPLPTHPPNHHYPTHPPTGQFNPAATTSTRRPVTARPTYPSYPTYRPVSTISTTTTTTTTTTKRPTAVAGNGGGVSANGLPLQCGMKNPVSPDQERIVGGTNASPHEFPWIAVLFKSGKQFCGGSLITNNHILTAAHCVARMTSWDVAALTVHLGDYNIRTDFEVQHVARRVKRLVRHKGFDFSHLHTDIAILTLNEPVKFTKEIQPICLPTSASQQTRSYSGHVATVAGWGSLRENGPQPSILQKVQIPIWTNSECAQKYGRAAPGGIIESMVCAGQAAKDSCSGDSGGPMIVNEGGRYVQVGIVSWGIGCGKGQYPGVYTRVTSLLPWIYKNIK